MAHLTEEDLVSYRDRESLDVGSPDSEALDPVAIREHLAACADCRAKLATLDRLFAMMDLPVPEPGPAYEREVWARIQARIAAEPARGTWRLGEWLAGASARSLGHWLLPQVGLVAGVTLLLLSVLWLERPGGLPHGGGVAGVWAPNGASRANGTSTPNAAQGPNATTASNAAPDVAQSAASIRNRVLVSAVGDHLQRAELLLTEFNNTDGHARGTIDLTEQQAWAEDLVSENRLYRRSAADINEDQLVGLLDDLERVLLEVAHAPAETTPEQLDRLRMRIGTQDVLFKVRVVGAGMRDRQQMAAVVDSPPVRSLSGS